MSCQRRDAMAPASPLRRRELLRHLLAGAAGVQLTAWIGACTRGDEIEAPAAPPVPPPPGASLVNVAWSRARAARKTLVVLVIPAEPLARDEHGRAFGQLLLYGQLSTLARLAACELVCARMTAVRAALAGVPGVPAEECTALAVVGGAAMALHADLTLEQSSGRDEAPLRRRIERLERALAPVLGAVQENANRFRDSAPAGAAWGRVVGCCLQVEGHEELSTRTACGAGYTPELSSRFLYYLVRE